ncbi:uncharacterized protein UTRI_02477 [Ustilago trichophora]|uniref:Sacsin/Nov domain-containing protein n=1 Tax=Ustilago trichophora TaxID=86804 RepID=A0A5C3E9E7_9BASI|nr:uncharacterized protein UTRI_02477 [Ustilago trichophora]
MASTAAGELARKALMDDARQEEAITVNQRALIDKILARYAAEFTVFRELLQNADDAGATHCELRFESQRSQAASSSSTATNDATLSNWVFRNDGKPFGKDDWSRLRRIAEGNPDPDRIGAFGVGSTLFSASARSPSYPLAMSSWASSGRRRPFTKRANNADRQNSPSGNPWTTFFMALREPAPFPTPPWPSQSSSPLPLHSPQRSGPSVFTGTITSFASSTRSLLFPNYAMPAHLNSYSPGRIMRVRDLESTAVQIDVQPFNSSLMQRKGQTKTKQSLASALGKTAGGGLTSMLQTSIHLRIATAMQEEYDASFPDEAEDADASMSIASSAAALDKGVRQIFSGLMPRLEDQGHAFIGFRTHQTTGFSGHIAARFIPQWSASRSTFAQPRMTMPRQSLKDRALHLMRFFTFRASSPSSRVSSLFLTSFLGQRVRTPSRSCRLEVSSTPPPFASPMRCSRIYQGSRRHPPDHVEEAPDFVREVRSRNLVQDITMDDVFQELSSRALTPPEMIACLKWWVSVAAHPSYDISLRSKLLNNAMITIADPKDTAVPEKIQPLSLVRFYLNTSRLPTDVPLPDTCLAYEVSKSFTTNELSRVFGWSELTVSAWLKNLVQISVQRNDPARSDSRDQHPDFPAFAEKVLLTLSRAWFALPSTQHDEIQQLLADITCIPTRLQMQKPNDAYFSNVSLFSDLPIVQLPSAKRWLVARRSGLISGIEQGDAFRLEKERLKKTAIFPKHGQVGPLKEDGKPRIIRHRASDLYEPTEALKGLELPVLDWADKQWKPSSDEARFVFDLGLRRYPPMETVLELASTTSNDALRPKALHSSLTSSTPTTSINTPSIGRKTANENKLVLRKPTEVFTNAEAAVMGFPVAGPEINLADLPKLGLRSNPTAPSSLESSSEFSLNDFAQLRGAEFIPVRRNKRATTRMLPRTRLLLLGRVRPGGADELLLWWFVIGCSVQGRFFYCDFGSVAGAFLKNCGVRNEPSIEEVASDWHAVYALKKPADVVIVDDANRTCSLPLPLLRPHEDLLQEGLYGKLGSPRLSTLVEERYSSSRSEIRKDAEWLKGALEVEEIDGAGLRLVRTLRYDRVHEQNQVSAYQAKIAGSASLHDMLSTSLRNLKRRGFHVDKILSQRKAEREAAEANMREERHKAEERAARRKRPRTRLLIGESKC